MLHATTAVALRLVAEPKTREQAAYEAIRGHIIAGRWRPGETLAVSHLARDLGISRIPVTNAVKRLASEGFLQVRPHLEAVVAPLDVNVVREIYLMRAALEALALSEAARRATADDIMTIRTQNDDLWQASATPETPVATLRMLDRAFHRQ
ncbi:MAG: GntR family transcriptional regulator, partial [Chloroflexia bacterium]|nr:GntR family transcriptional regulator [Chloroflexia bacterium]